MNCDLARGYSGAVADDELQLVPGPILEHIRACHDCGTEVEFQREAQRALRLALRDPVASDHVGVAAPSRAGGAPRPRRPSRIWLVAAAVVATLGSAAAAQIMLPHRGPVDSALADAVHAYGTAPAFVSSDEFAVRGWAAGAGVAVEVMPVPGEALTGARVTSVSGHRVVTMVFSGPRGSTEISVVPDAMVRDWPVMEATAIDNRPVGVLHHGSQNLIVVAADETNLHEVMNSLENGGT
ncbi:MAG: anti-sigma factor [Candidatus Dormibacteria bacterium]